MNVLAKFRKPYISIFLTALMLFVSCSKSDVSTLDNTMDYSIYNDLIRTSDLSEIFTIINSANKEIESLNSVDRGTRILEIVNSYYSTDLSFPQEFIEIADADTEMILATSLQNGWLSQADVNLVNQFMDDLAINSFDTALRNYENTVMNMSLSNQEFAVKNQIANALKSMNHYYPEKFDNATNFATTDKSGKSCFRSAVALTVASAALATCATVVACGFAVTAWILAYDLYKDNCLSDSIQ